MNPKEESSGRPCAVNVHPSVLAHEMMAIEPGENGVTTTERIHDFSGIRQHFTCVCHIVMFGTPTVIVGCVLPCHLQHSTSPLAVSRNIVIGQDVDP